MNVCVCVCVRMCDRVVEVGASVDSQFSHLEWMNKPRKEGGLGGLTIPLIVRVTYIS